LVEGRQAEGTAAIKGGSPEPGEACYGQEGEIRHEWLGRGVVEDEVMEK